MLGDCFDLIMDTYKDLLEFELYREILDKFNKLHKNPDFHLVFALGNHEVPVGKANPDFSQHKTEMLNNFKRVQEEMNIKYSFFTEDIFAQYILLQGFETQQPKLKLFDTIQDLLDDKTVEDLGFKNYFMAHGYQFDPNLDKFAGVWKLGLSWLTDDEISENNKKILESKFYGIEHRIDKKQEEYIMVDVKSYCKVCGKEIKSNLKYCESCSANLGEDDSFMRLRTYIKKLYEEEQKQEK